jgi:hypothetical protein
MTRSTRLQRRMAEVMPLSDFSEWKQQEIAEAVAGPKPPPKWLYFGPSDSPRPLAAIESRAWYEWHWQRGIDPDGSRSGLSPTLRQSVIERDGDVCQLCFGTITAGQAMHIDHIKPYSKGGRHVLSNLQVTHATCNLKKGARFDAED